MRRRRRILLQSGACLPEHHGLHNSDLEYGPPDWDRTHSFVFSLVAELPFGQGRRYMSDATGPAQWILGGWQFNTNTTIQSGLPFNVNYRDAGADRDTEPNRPDLVGDPEGPKTRDQWFNTIPIGSSGSAFGRPARGTFGNLPRAARTGLLEVRCVILQAHPARRRTRHRAAPRSGQPLQPRQPGESQLGNRRSREQQPGGGGSTRPRMAMRIRSGTSSSRRKCDSDGSGFSGAGCRVRGNVLHPAP